ncbi:MAG: hypothetical protein K6G57_01415 [Lachnospiraceae bacterium]|nr:hypothetical protein [Lachnospiraceae bacterium]
MRRRLGLIALLISCALLASCGELSDGGRARKTADTEVMDPAGTASGNVSSDKETPDEDAANAKNDVSDPEPDSSDKDTMPDGNTADDGIPSEYTDPSDKGIFEPATPYFHVICEEFKLDLCNRKYTKWDRGPSGFPEWGYSAMYDDFYRSSAKLVWLESYNDEGNIVQSVVKVVYETADDALAVFMVPATDIFFPGVYEDEDKPGEGTVPESWMDECRENWIEKNKDLWGDLKCIGRYGNVIYYDALSDYDLFDDPQDRRYSANNLYYRVKPIPIEFSDPFVGQVEAFADDESFRLDLYNNGEASGDGSRSMHGFVGERIYGYSTVNQMLTK